MTAGRIHAQKLRSTCRCYDHLCHQRRASQTQVDISQIVSRLLTTVQAVIMHSVRVSVKILKFGGLNTGWSTTPRSPTKKASASDHSLKGYQY